MYFIRACIYKPARGCYVYAAKVRHPTWNTRLKGGKGTIKNLFMSLVSSRVRNLAFCVQQIAIHSSYPLILQP